MFITVTLALPDGRDSFNVNANTPIKEFLKEHNANASGTATVMMDGIALNSADQEKSFAAHGVSSDCTIAICAKLQNA